MTDNLFKVFFLITYESSISKKIKYSLSNESGINLKISFTKKVKNKDKKEYILSVFSFDINNLKEENRDNKTNLFKAIINFNIQSNIYEKEILFREGRNNYIFNFHIENNNSIMLLDQTLQLRIFYESLEKQKSKNRKALLESLELDSIIFLKKNDIIYFDFFLDVLKLCYLKKERNSVLLSFQLGKIKFTNNLNPKGYESILSIKEKNPAQFCIENDIILKEEINEKYYLILLCFILNYENDEKIKYQKIEALLKDKRQYLLSIIPLYTQYYSNIKIPENYIYDIFKTVKLTYEKIKGILNYFPSNVKRLEIIYLHFNSIYEFCKENDIKLKMIELAPPQKDDNLQQIIYQIELLIKLQIKKKFYFLSFEQEYWERYCKYDQTPEKLMLINNITFFYQNMIKNLSTINQINKAAIAIEIKKNNNPDLKKIQKRLIMPTIGNISVGKSFFLNSMFGINYCQAKSDITTKFILFLRHIDNLKEPRLYKLEPIKNDNSYDFFYNDKEVFTGEENIKNKINKINEENKDSKEAIFYMLEIEIKEIENKEFLNKFDFLDVPGLNESGEDYINLYFEYIKDMIKYCLLIFSAERYNSRDSMEIIKNLKENLYVPIENFLIILNKIDMVNDLERTIRDFKKIVLNNGSFNIYRNTLVPVNSLELKSEIQIKNKLNKLNKFYSFINYYFMEYNRNKDGKRYIDFIKKMIIEEKKKLNNSDELKKRIDYIDVNLWEEIKSDFKRLEKEASVTFDFENKKEVKIMKLFYIFFKEKLLIPKISKAYNDINKYFNNIKDYDFPNKNLSDNNNKEEEFIYDNSDEHEILKDLDKFFEEVFISEKLKNYDNVVSILKNDFKILKNYIFNSSLNFVPIFGASNSGKSSIINCLLEKSILPCDSTECTKRAIIIRYLEEKEKSSLYSIKFNCSQNLNDIYYYYTKKELITENLDEIKEILSILNESFPLKEDDSFLLLETNIKFLENPKIDSAMKKRDICFIDFPGHNTNYNSFFNNNIYQKVLKMSSFFLYINSGKAFKDNSNKMLLSPLYKDIINIHKGDITAKQYIELCLFIFNKVDSLDEKEKNLIDINKQIKETLEIEGDDVDKISCSFFSSKLYQNYLLKIEEYKINEVIKLFNRYFELFKSQDKNNLLDEKEKSFVKFVEYKLKRKIKSDYYFEDIDLKNIKEEEITSSDIYKEINSYFDKIYEEHNDLNKEDKINYNDNLQNIYKYLICSKNHTKLKLYKESYASDTLEKLIDKIVQSYSLKEAEFKSHLEKFLGFLNIFFGIEEGFNTIQKNNLEELIQISINNVNKSFENFKGKEIIEKFQNIILTNIQNQKNSFKELMEKNNNDVNKIIELLENLVQNEMIAFKKLLAKEINKLEKNIGEELNRIGTEIISMNKNVITSFSTKEKLLVSITFCTLGLSVLVYGLFYKLPNLIINAVSEERKFQQFIEEFEEDIKKEFDNIRGSIESNIKSYNNIVTQNIIRFYKVFKADKNKNDENWKNAKEKYLIIYNKFKSLKKNK